MTDTDTVNHPNRLPACQIAVQSAPHASTGIYSHSHQYQQLAVRQHQPKGLEDQADSTQFIVGRQATSGPGSWPWVCSVGFLKTDVWEHQCGGTLFTYSHALMAAHCPETFKEQGRDGRTMVRCGDFHLMESSRDTIIQTTTSQFY